MTFKALQDAVLEELGYSTSASGTPRTRAKLRLNTWHKRLLSRPGTVRLLNDAYTYTFASVASTPVYGLPLAMGRINAIYETTNATALELRDLSWLRLTDPGLTASGTPDAYLLRGWFGVAVQPANASAIFVVSTSAADTTQTAYLDYLTATGQRLTASTTLTGLTAKALVASGALEITKFYLSAVCAGTVTLTEDSGAGAALGAIAIGGTFARYLHVQLWPTPSGVLTYSVDYTRKLEELVNDMDEPMLPPEFHDLLLLGAMADEFRMKDDSRYQAVRADLESRMSDLNGYLWNLADYKPSPAGQDEPPTSRLGGWFPRGT